MYYTYMLRCVDSSIYTGITKNIPKRMEEHFSQNKKCAKYTKRHKPKKLLKIWESESRALATKLEYHIKKDLNKTQKENLIIDNKFFYEYLNTKVNVNEYTQRDIKYFYI